MEQLHGRLQDQTQVEDTMQTPHSSGGSDAHIRCYDTSWDGTQETCAEDELGELNSFLDYYMKINVNQLQTSHDAHLTMQNSPFGLTSRRLDLSHYHPDVDTGNILWSVYQQNVERFIKLVHVPTTGQLLQQSLHRSTQPQLPSLSVEMEALVLCIYYVAITSLDPAEVHSMLLADKQNLVRHYRHAAEQALAKVDVLRTSSLAVLQALVLFLFVDPSNDRDQSQICWAMTSVAIRIAQAMKLDQDGSQLNLNSFESEIRRRVWWFIVALDWRSAEGSGDDLMIHQGSFSTRMPSNINDADFGPASDQLPRPRNGWSDCMFCISRCESLSLVREAFQTSSSLNMPQLNFQESSDSSASLATARAREELLVDQYRRIEERFLCPPYIESVPLFQVFASLGRACLAKARLLLYQGLLSSSHSSAAEEARSRIYFAAVDSIEHSNWIRHNPDCRPCRWLFDIFKTTHIVAFVLVEVVRRPWGPLEERAWSAVLEHRVGSSLTVLDIERANNIPLRRLLERAEIHRRKEIMRLKADLPEATRLKRAQRPLPSQGLLVPLVGFADKVGRREESWRRVIFTDVAHP